MLPTWEELCRSEVGAAGNDDLSRAIIFLKDRPARFRHGIARWLVAVLLSDPACQKWIPMKWNDILDIVADQVVHNRLLTIPAPEPFEVRPIWADGPDGIYRPFNQLPCTRLTTSKRVREALQVARREDPVLALGDDDMTSVALAKAGFTDVTAVDIDDAVLIAVRTESEKLGVKVQCMRYDLNDPVPLALRTSSPKLVFIDPPYSIEGIRLFLDGALAATERRIGTRVFISIHLMSLGQAGLESLDDMLNAAGLIVENIYRGFNSYPVPTYVRPLLKLFDRLVISGTLRTEEGFLPFFMSDALLLRKI